MIYKRNNLIRFAVVAALAGGAIDAHALLAPGGAAFTAAQVATELPITGILLTASGANELSAGSAITTFAPSTGQNLLVSVTINSGAKFVGNPWVLCSAAGGGLVSGVLNLGGAGTAQATFTVGPNNVSAQATAGSALTNCYVSATGLTVTGAHSDVTMSITYTYGTLASSIANGALVQFQSGLTATKAVGADVVALVTGAFVNVSGGSAATILNAGQLNWTGDGSAKSTATDLSVNFQLGDALGATSGSITVAGNALTATKTGTGGSAGVWLISAGGQCVTSGAGAGIASAVGGVSPVTFTGLSPTQLSAGLNVCLQFTGSTAIAAGSITGEVSGHALTGYSLPSPAALTLMTVSRNGTQLIAPLVQIPGGWISRMVLDNAGPAATYSVATLSETGTTATLSGEGLSGTVPANGMLVVDLPSVLAITPSTNPQRTSFSITVNGSNTNINGLYQIVAPSGALSNYVMIKQ